MKITLFILLVFSCNVLSAGKYSQGRMGAISCDDSLAADAGKQMILAGGNAVDAAVAAAFALAVTYPNAGNIGGGGFALIHLPNGEVHALDFRETAPRAAFATMYLDSAGNIDTDLSRSGPLSAGVPGTVRGLWEMHRKFGRLPWKQCLAPAILLAKNSFVLPPYMAALLTRFDANFRLFPATSDIFCRPDSQFTAGDTLYQEDLALVLQSLASEGPDVFYKGWIAQRIVKSMQASKGLISLEDLASYTAEWRQTVQFELNGYQIKTMGLPSSAGITMQQMLRLYERYFRENPTYAGSASLLHQMIEVNKRAFADRNTHLADPAFLPDDLSYLTDQRYLNGMLPVMPDSATAFPPSAAGTMLPGEKTETTHLSVIDSDRMAVSLTYTLNGNFGSKFVVPGTGILLNNEMDDFTSKPGAPNMFGLVMGDANKIEPGKRMLSSMSPAMVCKNGDLVMVTGSPGGSTILTTVAQTIFYYCFFNIPPAEIDAIPRVHHQGLPREVFYESRNAVPDAVLNNLKTLGHRLKSKKRLGNTHTIIIEKQIYHAKADWRGGGHALAW
jgi:gamma-glutamyltranspeptidase/glutathione hydrolase